MAAKLTGKARSDALANLRNWQEVPGRDAIKRDLKFKAPVFVIICRPF